MVRKSVRQAIKACDLFAQPAALRYGQQPQYESLTGVFVSIFTNTILSTMRKQSINQVTTTTQQKDPSSYKVGTDTFMFAVGITGIDLNQGDRWFDITFENTSIIDTVKTKNLISLQKCQKSQWTRINNDMDHIYDKIGMDQWLCPPDGLIIQIQGKFSSDIFKYFKFKVSKCSTSNLTIRACVANTTIQSYLNANQTFTFNFYFMNTILNPGIAEDISTYLDDLNYFPFTPTDGVSANFFLSSYEIDTDQSIYPVQNITNKKGGISTVPAQTINYRVRQKDYMKLYIRKSSLSIFIQRSFKKIDETFSYIGGLFSAILTVLIVMRKYNQLSYEMQVAKNLYHFDKNQPLKSEQFNFLVFIGYLVYAFFQTINIKLPWPKIQVYFRSLQQVRKQMDIRLIMKKILYSQRMAIAVFDQPKAKILHLQQPLTLQQAEQIRKDHRFYDKLQNKYFDYDKIREQSQKQKQQQQLQTKNQSIKKGVSEKSQISIDQILFKQQQLSQKEIKSPNYPKIKMKKPLGSRYKRKQTQKQKQIQKQKQKNITKNAGTILDFILKDDLTQKQIQLKEQIQDMKRYVYILKEQTENGDKVSQKILQRFDPKLMKMIIASQKQQEEWNNQQVGLSNFTINLYNNNNDSQKKRIQKQQLAFSSNSLSEV